jgi:asparagine synthase (glutamine-hydrolysing)
MCGIAGGWWPSSESSLEARLSEALSALKKRGPDDSGYEFYHVLNGVTAFGHTRLSVIDLSSAGHQPMQSADASLSIIFNGEIYNYRELRTELKELGYCFVSDSDTEVLLAAWHHWGRECLWRLVGMFAFVVLDRGRGTLTCIRDVFGIKPFFYTQEQGGFLFASEVAAVKALRKERIQLNWQRAYDYLVHADYDSGPSSFLDGVLHLLPGHLIELNLASGALSQQQRWWEPRIEENSSLTFPQATELVRERFLKNIRLHLRSDVPFGAALSGGIDSSAVVCAIRYVEPDLPIHTFSFIAKGSDVSEEAWVDRINAHVAAIPHKISVSPNDLARDLDDMIQTQGEPFGSTSIYAQYRVFQFAKQNGVTVTLDGQGADEMLAGYNGYPGQRLRSLLEKGQFAEAAYFLNEWSKWPGRNRIGGVKRLAAEMTDGRLYALLRKINGSDALPSWINEKPLVERGVLSQFPWQGPLQSEAGRRVVAELALALTQRGLPALLRHGDRNSMRFSVESRVPFLTLDMVNLLLSLPESYLISPKGETKHVFRAAMRGIVPDDVLNRRDKIGFATPEQEWLLSMSDTVRGWLKEDLHLPFFNQQEVVKAFDRIVAGKQQFSWQVWRWINFSRWYANFVA